MTLSAITSTGDEKTYMNIKTGDLVTFKKGLYSDEEGAIYRILEINEDRCFLELVNTSMTFRPQSVAMLTDLDLYAGNLPPDNQSN